MVSTFHGIETARRALHAQRSALYTTSHNIANANTKGYTRQRVNFSTTNPYNAIFGQIGTGVQEGSIERIRESFLDVQYRLENSKHGYYTKLSAALSKIEDIMNEPTESGLHHVMETFWKALEDLANHPENSGARQVVASTGQMVAETINYYYNSLARIQRDLGAEIDTKVKYINSLIAQIDELNRQIASVEPHGKLPNDLYDRRDVLVDELSKYINIKVNTVVPEQYGQHPPNAIGLYEIEIVQADGSAYDDGNGNRAKLLSIDTVTGQSTIQRLEVTGENSPEDPLSGNVSKIQVGNVLIDNLNFVGELGGLIRAYGYNLNGEQGKGHLPDMMERLNNYAFAFASEFNAIHQQGYDLSGEQGIEFFVFNENNPAQTLRVNDAIINDPGKIAAARSLTADGEVHSGDNRNALELAKIKGKNFGDYVYLQNGENGLPDGMTEGGTLDSYYASMIGDLGVNTQSAMRNRDNVQVLLDSVENQRQSVSGVSLDEELTNMIMFQHAYNAAGRMITVLDEMLDRIINGMGVVGR